MSSILDLFTALAGGAVKAKGAYDASAAQRNSLNYQSAVAANNAILDQDKATIAEQNGLAAVQSQGLKTAQTLGAQKVALGANGVELNQGSAQNVQATTEMMGQHDANQLQINAMREAWGYQVQGNEQTSNAAALKSMAGGVNPALATTTSLMGSAGAVSSAWSARSKSTDGQSNWAMGS